MRNNMNMTCPSNCTHALLKQPLGVSHNDQNSQCLSPQIRVYLSSSPSQDREKRTGRKLLGLTYCINCTMSFPWQFVSFWNLIVCSCVFVYTIQVPAFVFTCVLSVLVQCTCNAMCLHLNKCKKYMCGQLLFRALALSWKGIVVAMASVQTLIIIIIIINHPSSGVPGHGNTLNHWPGHTLILHCSKTTEGKKWGGIEGKNVSGKKKNTRKKSDVKAKE